MTNHRPLEDTPARALLALHEAIEAQDGLIVLDLADDKGRVCAIGSLSNTGLFGNGFTRKLNKLGLDGPGMYYSDTKRFDVEELNDEFEGTYEERREFMLRHIVGELHLRQLSLPGEKTAGTPHRPREKKEEVKA